MDRQLPSKSQHAGKISGHTGKHSVEAKPSVLFLCDGQAAASLIADAMLRHKASAFFDPHSAYTATMLHQEEATKQLSRLQIASQHSHPKPVEAISHLHFEFLVAMTPASVQSGKKLPGYTTFVPWDVTEGCEKNSEWIYRNVNANINYFMSLYLFR